MRLRAFSVLLIASVVAACSSADRADRADRADTLAASSELPAVRSLARAFAHAAQHASVPRDLLVAIAHVEDGLMMPAQRLDLHEDSDVPAAGPLMLRRGKLDTLARAALLAGTSELALRKDADLALDAGALVLAELGAKTSAQANDLASWKSAIEEMSGYADDDHREEYAHRVFAALARGGKLSARDGETIVLERHDLPPTLTLDISSKLHTLATAQYPGAEWIPTSCTNKCTTGRAGATVQYIVIHDTEGGWDASVSTLQNDPQKSVQYIVGTDGRVAQFVTEDTTAWHAGNFYFNQRSIGIEHVGYSTKPYTEAEYAASAKLVDHLAKKYAVPRDRAHVIGHDQIPNGTKISQSSAPCSASPKSCESNLSYGGAGHHTDPGVWEWPTFMARFGGTAKCNDVGELWTCSYDKKKAFRCAAGTVSLETCDGAGACEPKPVGQDDVCHTAPKPSSTTPPIVTDPAASSDPPPVSETTGAPGLPAPPLEAEEPAPADEAGGCSTASIGSKGQGRNARGLGSLAFAAVALVLGAARTRRRSRSQKL
jgi:N-acetyl-anhydromuramyl-L-alanine amidase AmpD